MRPEEGRVEEGPAGRAVELLLPAERESSAEEATLAAWFITAPGQSPAWSHYLLSAIHLRPIEGVKPAVITVPRATHELLVIALDPGSRPVPTDSSSWRWLLPVNVCEQVELPGDESAVELARMAARAVVLGALPAEPPLSGAVEPWRTSMVKTSAHLRGEEHAP